MSKDIDDYQLFQKQFALFKGDPGTAKSPAAVSWPDPYIIDLDGRIASVASYWRGKKKVKYDTIINNYPLLCNKIEGLLSYNPYGTVILDSITTLARSLATLIFESRGSGVQRKSEEKDGKTRTYLNAAKIPNKFDGIAQLEIDDYKTENGGIIQIMDGLRALYDRGCNVIVIAHVVEVTQDQLKGAPKVTRSIMTGGKKIAAELPVYFDEAYHFYCDGGLSLGDRKFKCLTRNAGQDWAKTALPVPDEIDFTDKNLYEEVQRHIADYKTMNPSFFEKKEEKTNASELTNS